MTLDFSIGLRILPAGEQRLRNGDDPGLPIRELSIERDGRSLTVWVGPVDYGEPEEELWELDVET